MRYSDLKKFMVCAFRAQEVKLHSGMVGESAIISMAPFPALAVDGKLELTVPSSRSQWCIFRSCDDPAAAAYLPKFV